MGWIRDRHMRSGGSLNSNPRKNGSDKGPLRKIEAVIQPSMSMFDRDIVRFECGHEGRATAGAVRGRCRQCKELEES